MSEEIKELTCQKCNCEYPVWYTDNELWKRVCEQDEIVHFLCPTCFATLAENVGYTPKRWYLGFESNNERFKDVISKNARLESELAELGEMLEKAETIHFKNEDNYIDKADDGKWRIYDLYADLVTKHSFDSPVEAWKSLKDLEK